MRIRIETELSAIATTLANQLTNAGHSVEVQFATVGGFELAYTRTLPIDEVTTLLTHLRPLSPAIMPVAEVRDADVVLRLGDDRPLNTWDVTLYVDDVAFGKTLRSRLNGLGFNIVSTEVEPPEEDQLRYGGATPLARQVILSALNSLGVPHVAEQKVWSESDDDLWLYVRNPSLVGKPLEQRTTVVLASDDLSAALKLQATLTEAGFSRVQLRPLETTARPMFRLQPGPLDTDTTLRTTLLTIVERFLAASGAEAGAYPLRVTSGDEETGGCAVISLPLARLAKGDLRPWAGSSAARWDVKLRTDSPAMVTHLLEPLHLRGLTHVQIESMNDSLIDVVLRYPPAAEPFAELIAELLEEDVSLDIETVARDNTLPDDSHNLIVELPVADDLDREARLKRAATHWNLTLKTPDPASIATLEHALRALPWSDFTIEAETRATAQIQYGGAPLAILQELQRWVTRETGHELTLHKAWGDSDNDIWIYVPSGGAGADPHADPDRDADDLDFNLQAWLQEEFGDVAEAQERLNSRGLSATTAPRSLIELSREQLRVGPITLPRRVGLSEAERALVPTAGHFAHYCLDTTTATSLVHVAESALLGEPCLLEGETSVSKTSVVLYLAMLLGQPVVRLNLNGQTDTGELVGRFVPRDELPKEGEPAHPWRWQDGLVVQAMKRGWWVVLDELNLAEPQILERLNPALERIPSLVLTEHRGEVIGAGGTPVSPYFRLFATMNPAEYAGRSALSPAYRDRWRGYSYVRAPGEAEYLAMLRFLVYGEHPSVQVLGERFAGAEVEAPLAQLAEVAGLHHFLRALARFHAGLEGAARNRTGALGARRKERYVFTRRGLLAVMDYLAARGDLTANAGAAQTMTLRKALLRYYLGRVRPGADRALIAQLLDAAGIGPNTWAPERIDSEEHDEDDDAGSEGTEDDREPWDDDEAWHDDTAWGDEDAWADGRERVKSPLTAEHEGDW